MEKPQKSLFMQNNETGWEDWGVQRIGAQNTKQEGEEEDILLSAYSLSVRYIPLAHLILGLEWGE